MVTGSVLADIGADVAGSHRANRPGNKVGKDQTNTGLFLGRDPTRTEYWKTA